jgi:polar amino acid transport system substrate-binding protein
MLKLGIHTRAGLATLGVLVVCGAAPSQSKADALKTIRDRGSLTCGVLTISPPFGYLDPATRKPAGFDVDMCSKVAAKLGVSVELKPISLESRVAELSMGRIDIASAALAYNKDRAEQISFSHAYYQQPLKIIVRADSNIQSFADLKGKRISATKGSVIEHYIIQQIPEVTVVNFQDTASAFLALKQGKVNALGMTNSSGVRYINETGNEYRMLQETLSLEPSAMGVRKGEDGLVAAINKALEEMDQAGEIEATWNKWFGPGTTYKIPLGMKLARIAELKK